MRFGADGGLWSTGPIAAPLPLVAVLEVSGAVLSWLVDADPADPPSITFTDPERADWLWRVLGETGHVVLLDALRHREPGSQLELDDVAVQPGSTAGLRRLAVGHWLRRWWPVSERDGIAALDGALLDAEVALLTAAAEDFFTDDTLDSDPVQLLAPRVAELNAVSRHGDPRVQAVVRACRELAADSGVDWPATVVAPARREDYALAAGPGARPPGAAIAEGTASVGWSAVPPGVFDAAEDTVDWSVVGTEAVVRVALVGPGSPAGIEVALRADGIGGAGVLDAAGRAVLALFDAEGAPVSETSAWNADWSRPAIRIGADVEGESAATRERVRGFARRRLSEPGAEAFLAEVLAAESDY
ncbi:hypothetical protein MCHIJ_35680 [Mycolicibacterium chitae]|uniref:Uncharacterized protein n=1 Tax=Mycolicibacterium chitae TaxID=1792 RepID=A0A3S4RSH7_MYCCI|nr:hypothetical protein [Mycolicibacterium chitae]MCV7106503.1 hypothetical protein [Mycolicibacterium chitae]BBZ04131.1 hypothetical protein MCHIJ_35680 [Mycolicibacterium chitae]VEG47782.1 Uncharacterised protein [Mycolicibacterium chitae]